ncbi:hypothetical protein LguiA_014704 [Lonicera macranthoides]
MSLKFKKSYNAGATLGELLCSIAKKSRTLAFPAGVCPTVGVGGHFSGGGFGMISRKYGLAIDAPVIDVNDKIDENLVIRLFLRSMNASQNGDKTIQVFFTAMFVGGVDTLLRVMQENFPELRLLREDYIEMSWIESILYMVEFPRGIWERLYEEVESVELQFTPYGGWMNDISESGLPFPYRSGKIHMIHYRVGWGEEGVETRRHMSWIRKIYNYMALYVSKSSRAAYLNYRDLDLGVNNKGNTSYAKASIWGTKYLL